MTEPGEQHPLERLHARHHEERVAKVAAHEAERKAMYKNQMDERAAMHERHHKARADVAAQRLVRHNDGASKKPRRAPIYKSS